jgi:hypothetical protein
VKVANDSGNTDILERQRWLVAKVCSEYLQYCQRGVANTRITTGHHANAVSWLNDLCEYCGALHVAELKKKLHWDQDPSKAKYSAYTCRHTFARRMLSGYWNNGVGCSIETLAELIGDTPKVAFDNGFREPFSGGRRPSGMNTHAATQSLLPLQETLPDERTLRVVNPMLYCKIATM